MQGYNIHKALHQNCGVNDSGVQVVGWTIMATTENLLYFHMHLYGEKKD
jgi:hypothetical protein